MVFTTAGSKQENAIVERANREVMRHLRNVIMDRRAMDEWSRYLTFRPKDNEHNGPLKYRGETMHYRIIDRDEPRDFKVTSGGRRTEYRQ